MRLRRQWITGMALLLVAGSVSAQSLTLEGTLNLAGRTAVDAVGRYAYTGGASNFAVVDVNNPAAPVLRGQANPGTSTIHAISVEGNHAYCAGDAGGLVVMDVSAPALPQRIGALTLGGACIAVAARDTLVAAATQTQVALAGVRDPAHPHLLASFGCAARWVEFDSDPTRLHVGTTGGLLRLRIVTSISGGDTTFQLQQDASYGSALYTPIELAPPFVNAVSQATLAAIRRDAYTLAGQYTAPAVIRAVAGGSGFSFAALTNGSVVYLDQRQNTPMFVAAVSVPGSPAGIAPAQSGSTPLVVVAHSGGVSVLSYSPLAVSENPTAPLPRELSLEAFPNPFNAAVELRLTTPAPGEYTLRIFDVLGREIETRALHLPAGAFTETIDFHSRTAGIYFARLDGPVSRATTKLIFLP